MVWIGCGAWLVRDGSGASRRLRGEYSSSLDYNRRFAGYLPAIRRFVAFTLAGGIHRVLAMQRQIHPSRSPQ
jgi:hypothetical protein